jgi:histone deacetylase 1/2
VVHPGSAGPRVYLHIGVHRGSWADCHIDHGGKSMGRFKSEVFTKFHEFQTLVERLFDRKIITMQTDWGGEYQKLHSFFETIGITHHVSCPHAHQQNGTAERKHRHTVEVGLALLAHASMPLKFWDEAFIAATYLINHTPSKVLNY